MPHEQKKLLSFLHNAAHVCRTPKYDVFTVFGIKSVPIFCNEMCVRITKDFKQRMTFCVETVGPMIQIDHFN
jgi:hypothetical protein